MLHNTVAHKVPGQTKSLKTLDLGWGF